jgi:hypothetical protein
MKQPFTLRWGKQSRAVMGDPIEPVAWGLVSARLNGIWVVADPLTGYPVAVAATRRGAIRSAQRRLAKKSLAQNVDVLRLLAAARTARLQDVA